MGRYFEELQIQQTNHEQEKLMAYDGLQTTWVQDKSQKICFVMCIHSLPCVWILDCFPPLEQKVTATTPLRTVIFLCWYLELRFINWMFIHCLTSVMAIMPY